VIKTELILLFFFFLNRISKHYTELTKFSSWLSKKLKTERFSEGKEHSCEGLHSGFYDWFTFLCFKICFFQNREESKHRFIVYQCCVKLVTLLREMLSYDSFSKKTRGIPKTLDTYIWKKMTWCHRRTNLQNHNYVETIIEQRAPTNQVNSRIISFRKTCFTTSRGECPRSRIVKISTTFKKFRSQMWVRYHMSLV
jgi:hypothetical protein